MWRGGEMQSLESIFHNEILVWPRIYSIKANVHLRFLPTAMDANNYRYPLPRISRDPEMH